MKNLALMVYITVGSAAYPILEFLEEWGTENFEVSMVFLHKVNLFRSPHGFVCLSLFIFCTCRKFLLQLFPKLQKFL